MLIRPGEKFLYVFKAALRAARSRLCRPVAPCRFAPGATRQGMSAVGPMCLKLQIVRTFGRHDRGDLHKQDRASADPSLTLGRWHYRGGAM